MMSMTRYSRAVKRDFPEVHEYLNNTTVIEKNDFYRRIYDTTVCNNPELRVLLKSRIHIHQFRRYYRMSLLEYMRDNYDLVLFKIL